MQYVLLTLLSLVAYVGGLVIVVRVTPRLLSHSFDESYFVGMAALDIVGALLAFGGVILMFAMFNGNIAIKILNFLLFLGILAVALRIAVYCFRPRVGTQTISRYVAGAYCLFLAIASVFCLFQLFQG